MSNTEALNLLSRLSGRSLSSEAVDDPPVLFLSALMSATLSVIYADGTVAEAEKELLDKMLDTLLPVRTETRDLLDAILEGFIEDPVYKTLSEWLPLARALNPREQLLLLSLGYEMAATDGSVDPREREHLSELARALAIEPQQETAIASIAENNARPDAESMQELRDLLEPKTFAYLGIRLVDFEVVELLSRWSGYPFSQVNTPPVAVFLGALAVLTLEMMAADGQITPQEMDLALGAIAELLPASDADGLRVALIGMVENLQANAESRNPSDWLKLTRTLLPSERTLLLAFAYELAAVDGIVPAEREYLGAIVQSLSISAEVLPLLDAAFAGETLAARTKWHELLAEFHPDGFTYLSPEIVAAARKMHQRLLALTH